jgi:hypothetical protein
MSHIYLSYSKKDHFYARQLADTFIKIGFCVWIDQRIENSYWAEISQSSLQDFAAFVVVMSHDSQHSKLVQREVKQAQDLHKPIFPLLLSGKSWMPRCIDVSHKQLPDRNFYVMVAKHAPHYKGQGREFEAADVVTYPTLRYGGIYVSQKDVLRFYEDGLVMEEDAKDADETRIFAELDRSHENKVNHGQYQVTGRDLNFTLNAARQKIAYQGTIDNDRLELEWYNQKTHMRGHRIYEFVPLE